MAKTNLDYVIRWLTDTSSLNKTVNEAKRLDTVLETGFDQLISAARRGELSIDETRQALRQLGQSDADIDKVTASLKEANQQAQNLKSNAEGGLITAGGRSLLRGEREEGRFQSFALGTLGDIPGVGGTQAFAAAAGVFQLIDALPNLDFAAKSVVASIKENISQIGATGVGLIGGLGLVLLGTKLLTDEYNRNYETTTRLLDVQSDYFRLIQTGTTDTLTEQRAKLQADLDAARDAQAQLQAQSDAVHAALRERFGDGQIINDLFTRLGLTGAEVKALDDALAAAGINVSALEGSLGNVDRALGSSEVAANNAAAALAALAEEQLADAQKALELDHLTKEQRDARVAQNGREIEILYNLIQAGEITGEALVETQVQMQALADDTLALEGVTDSYVDILAREEAAKKALTDQTDAYFEALKSEEQIRAKLADINQKINDTILERDEKVLAAETERNEKLAQITADFSDKRGEITAEGEEQRAKLIADSAAKIAKITRDSGRTLFNLVAERDALGHRLEQVRAADALADAAAEQSKASEQQQKAHDKALVQAQKAHDKNLDTAIRAFDKQNRAYYDSANRQLNTLYTGQRAQEVALQNNQIALQSIALYGSNGQRVIHTQMWNDLAALAVAGARNFTGAFMGALRGGSSTPQTLSATYPGGPSSQQVLDQHFDRRLAQTLGHGSRGGFNGI